MWIDRLQDPLLRKHAESRPVVVITGARQTGKTTLVRRLFPDHAYVSLDLPSAAAQAEEEPEAFLKRYPPPIVVDEVQYAPDLFRFIKQHVDADRAANGQFVLTGSQPFRLMRDVSDSLAGRAGIVHLAGLSFHEVTQAGIAMSPADFLLRGGFPELYEKPQLDPQLFYPSYVATYLERDLRTLLEVGSLRDFERFIRACALRTSQVLNKAELARDVGISPSTAGAWLSALERSGIVALLEPWFSNATKSLVKAPKLHFMDTGLCAFLMGMTETDDLLDSPLTGALWETLVFCELNRLLGVSGRWQLHYWRDRTKEADFLLHRAGKFLAADAKWSENPRNTGSLDRVLTDLGEYASGLLICRSANAFPMKSGIRAIPLGDMFTALGS